MTDIEETPVADVVETAPESAPEVAAEPIAEPIVEAEPDVAAEVPADIVEPVVEDAAPDHGPASLHVQKNAAGEWEVVSTYADGNVTTTAWASLRHAILNAEQWVRAHI